MAGVRNQGSLFGMFEVLDLSFPLESSAVISDFFNIHEFRWSIHARVACATPCIMLFEPAKWVSGPACVVATIGAQEHVAIVCHESLLAADQEINNCHQRTADDDAEEVKPKARSKEN